MTANRPKPDPGATLEFVAALWRLHHALESASEAMEARIGITAPQRLVIRLVGRFPGIMSGQLASMLGVHPGTASAQLRRLEARKLIKRVRDPRDRRRVMIGLTAEGRGYDRPMEGTVEQAIQDAMVTLDPAHLAIAGAVLQRVCERLGTREAARH